MDTLFLKQEAKNVHIKVSERCTFHSQFLNISPLLAIGHIETFFAY